MENTAPLFSTDRKVQMGCFAAIPGSGPTGQLCCKCSLLAPDGSKFVCDKYRQMAGRKGKPISPNSSACKYFVARKAFNSAKEG